MSKTKRRRKAKPRVSVEETAGQPKTVSSVLAQSARPARVARGASLQNTVFALMVTLGCLVLAAFFTFFYSEDANHLLYGGVMVLTALGWLFITTRRWSSYRQSVRI